MRRLALAACAVLVLASAGCTGDRATEVTQLDPPSSSVSSGNSRQLCVAVNRLLSAAAITFAEDVRAMIGHLDAGDRSAAENDRVAAVNQLIVVSARLRLVQPADPALAGAIVHVEDNLGRLTSDPAFLADVRSEVDVAQAANRLAAARDPLTVLCETP